VLDWVASSCAALSMNEIGMSQDGRYLFVDVHVGGGEAE
jgi:hypothetical protein